MKSKTHSLALFRSFAIVLLCAAAVAQTEPHAGTRAPQTSAPLAEQPIVSYIHNGWDVLTRSMTDCKTVTDERDPRNSVVYLPAGMAAPAAVEALQQKCAIKVDHLPKAITAPGELATTRITPQGLLYLPNSYVVPGGFFNEMYGWDSYFIILGLLRDGRTALARGMVENFEFEIENYGAILNANRTYFLSRSQPPFLSSMIMAVHAANKAAGTDDRQWLQRAYQDAVRDYQMWTRAPHLAGNTGLSRYFDMGEGPGPEIADINDPYYYDVAGQLLRRPELIGDFLSPEAAKSTPETWPRFSVYLCPKGTSAGMACPELETLAFTSDYYKGDRSDRESGFDITFRFGPFAGATHHYAPVCLNSLLFKTEQDLAELSQVLGKSDEAAQWRQRADARRAAVDKYLWDAAAGMYFDFDTEKNQRSSYVYASMFYPLWAGLASPEQARAVAANLKKLERPGGLATSDRETGVQWDLPYGWAPLQLLAAQGLRRYGFTDDANRLSREFLTMVIENFRRDGTIREKYNVVTRSTQARVTAGYQTNVVGFGWTNGVFVELLSALPESERQRLESSAAAAR